MRDTVLFDLDGTLLPMDQNTFIKAYFARLAERLAPFGYSKEALIGAVWKGTMSMVANDGSMTNRERFWKTFESLAGGSIEKIEAECDCFYTKEFQAVKAITKPSDVAFRVLAILREKGYSITLATNPVFPAVGVHTRLSWIGLKPEDFDYITTYENSRYCKPNINYFLDVCQKIGKSPEDCYMVGNNTDDDLSALKLGIEVFMITDFLENEKNIDISDIPRGSLDDLITWANNLPTVSK